MARRGRKRTQPDGMSSDPVEVVEQLYKPSERECALLLLELIRSKEQEMGKEMTRLRIAEISLRRLWVRRRITPELVEGVSGWLSGAGITLFDAGTTYAVVRTDVVEGWPRIASKRLNTTLLDVGKGTFDFSTLQHLLAAPRQEDSDDQE